MKIEDASNIYLGSSAASKVMLGDTQVWPVGPKDYSREYLTITPRSSGNFLIALPQDLSTSIVESVSYNVNGTGWTTITNDGTRKYVTVNVAAGDVIRVKGISPSRTIHPGNNYDIYLPYGTRHTTDGGLNLSCQNVQYDISGNIMSLIYGDSFIGKTNVSSNAFTGLFAKWDRGSWAANSCPVDASNLILPSITSSSSTKSYIFAYMFSQCSTLVSGPTINCNFTSYAQHGYYYMFYNCSSLTSVTFYDQFASSNTYNMFDGISTNGTIYGPSTQTWVRSPNNYYNTTTRTWGIPSTWSVVAIQS